MWGPYWYLPSTFSTSILIWKLGISKLFSWHISCLWCLFLLLKCYQICLWCLFLLLKCYQLCLFVFLCFSQISFKSRSYLYFDAEMLPKIQAEIAHNNARFDITPNSCSWLIANTRVRGERDGEQNSTIWIHNIWLNVKSFQIQKVQEEAWWSVWQEILKRIWTKSIQILSW